MCSEFEPMADCRLLIASTGHTIDEERTDRRRFEKKRLNSTSRSHLEETRSLISPILTHIYFPT